MRQLYNLRSILILSLCCSFIAGCASTGNGPGNSPADAAAQAEAQRLKEKQALLRQDALSRQQQTDTAAAKGEDKQISNNAVVALLEEARSAQQEGDEQRANLVLERALRISPDDAAIYLELAKHRLEGNDYTQARAFALRGLSLKPNSEIEKALRSVIEQTEKTGSA